MPRLPRFLTSPWTWATTFVLVALYAAAGFLLVPRLLANGVHGYFDRQFHRQVELGAIAFNPFTLELTVEHFGVPDADGAPLAGFDRLYVNLQFLALLRGGMDFRAIALDGPRARLVRRADGRLNVMDLAPPPSPQPEPNPKPPRLWIEELAIRGGDVSFVDQSGRTTLDVTLKPITFTLHNFSTTSEGNAYLLAARSTQGESLEWRGTFGIDPVLESEGSFKIERVLAKTLVETSPGALPFDIAQGEFSVSGSYEFAERGSALNLKLRIDELLCTNVGLRATGEQDSWVLAPRVVISGTTIDVGKANVDVEHVLVERPVVQAWRDHDGTLNLLRLSRAALKASAKAGATPAPPPAAPELAAATTPSPAWTVRVPDIKVTGGDLTFEDRVPAHPVVVHVAPYDASVAGFAIPAAGPLAVELVAQVNDTGHVSAKGTLGVNPLAGSFAIDAAGLGLATLQPYVEASTAMTIKGGTASAKGTVTLSAGNIVDFRGDASVDALRTVDNALEEDFVKWRSLRLLGIGVHSAPLSLKVRELQAHEPYVRLIIGSNGLTNLSAVLKPNVPPPVLTPVAAAAGTSTLVATLPEPPPPPPPPTPKRGAARAPVAPAPAAALPVEVGLVRVLNGSMNFSDFSIKPNVVTGIEELNGTIKGLSGKPDSRADIQIEGKVDRYAPVAISGQVNFLSAVAYTNVKMSFKNVELGVLSPYSGRFAGYRIDKGKLSVDLNYLVENRKLTANHRIVVNQLQLGERVESPDATHLPVKLAIALLKDRNGVIELELPVTGSLDDPQFRLGPIIWKVVVNLIEKAVTAPFALLGKLFGGGEEISYLDFPAGSATLDATARGKVTALVKALDSRPGLNVDLPQVSAPALDADALAAQKWHAELEARAIRRLGAHAGEAGAVDRLLGTPKDYRALLEESYKDKFGHRAAIPAAEPAKGAPAPDPTATAIAWLEGQLQPRFVAAPAEIDALGQARAAAVQSALLDGTGIDPTRVFIIKSPPLPATSGPVRMQLALH